MQPLAIDQKKQVAMSHEQLSIPLFWVACFIHLMLDPHGKGRHEVGMTASYALTMRNCGEKKHESFEYTALANMGA